MYEEFYKRANDKIPTADAKKRVLEKLDAPKKVNYSASVVRIAALAACFVFAFSMVSIYEYSKKGTQTPLLETEQIIAPRAVGESYLGTQNAPKEKPIQKPTTKPLEIDGIEEGIGNQGIIINEGYVIAEPILANEQTAREIRDVRAFTKSDYFKYLGKDMERDIKLPDGFALLEEEKFYAEVDDSGEPLWDIKSFVYKKGDVGIEIRTTKNLSIIQEIIQNDNYKKSSISGFDAVISSDGKHFSGYMIANDIAFSVFGDVLEATEIEALFESLAK